MECRIVLLSLLSVALLAGFGSTLSLPKSWTKCKQSDPNFNECVRGAVQDVIRRLKNKGVASLGVFPLDPLDVTEMNILQGNSGPVNINLNFKDIHIHGISESTVTEYNTSLSEYKLYCRSLTPAYKIQGGYSINGRMLILPIVGKGKCDIVLEDLDVHHYIQGEPLMRDGKEYMKIIDYRITLEPKRFTSQLENLFNGDKRLGEAMNNFMNENWMVIFPELRPSLEDSFGQLFLAMANRIFTKVPLNEIFLP